MTLQRFKESGRTIILITHKLREPMALADRISVLRDGVLVGTVNKEDTSVEELARMMVGRPVVFSIEKSPATPGDVVLSVNDLEVQDERGVQMVKGIDLEVRAGEILGIAGVEGNGQTELIEALAGLLKPKAGKIQISGLDITGKNPRYVRESGISHIPEDRHLRGLVLSFTVAENLTLGRHYQPPFATGPAQMMLDLSEADALS
ncbi:MAG: ATP-binding cassette domain-containing protein, partial [Candidatus Thorarchaeota archaeon]